MFSSERNELRMLFFSAWEKYKNKLTISELEGQIVELILAHPEYHPFFEDIENQNKDFKEANPFLHLSLHLAIRDQIKLNRPAGIQTIFQNLAKKYSNELQAEHEMMTCLEYVLWEAQRSGRMPDEGEYLECLNKL